MNYHNPDRLMGGRQSLPPVRTIPEAAMPEEDPIIADVRERNLEAIRVFNMASRTRTAGAGRSTRR